MSAAFELARMAVRALPPVRGKLRVARLAIRMFGPDAPARLPDRFGNRIWCPSLSEPIAAALFAHGVYEPATIKAILARLPTDGAYVDVGANIGAIALPVARRRPHARVVCVEADPEIAATLRRNVAESGLGAVEVVERLAGAEAKAVGFYRAPADKFGMGSVGPQFDGAPVTLDQQPLDDILDGLGLADVSVVKLDIEGAELDALRGLARRLAGPAPPAIVFEFNDWSEARIDGRAPGDSQRYLASLGYMLREIGPDGRLTPLPAPLTAGGAMILAERTA